MPTTPGLTINDQAVWDRVFAAFNGSPSEFKTWFRAALKQEVETRELLAMQAKAQESMRVKREEFVGFLDSAT